jgi:hypothetical protein
MVSLADEPRITGPSKVKPGGVDPLGLRQINFDLMDEVLPGLNNVADRLRPFILMTWAWRRARSIVNSSGKGGASDADLRDFVDRVEAIYTWSQFLEDPAAGIPGGQALAALLDPSTSSYSFGGKSWESRRDLRRTSTGLISPLNYGPGLRAMGWLAPTSAVGVFSANPELDAALDEFEAAFAPELAHPAFSKFGSVVVDREDVERWAPLWSLGATSFVEQQAGFERLSGKLAHPKRRHGLQLVERAYAAIKREIEEVEIVDLRRFMAQPPEAWLEGDGLAPTALAWRQLQIRQLFRYALELSFFWLLGVLEGEPRSSQELGQLFSSVAGGEGFDTATRWFEADALDNPVDLIDELSSTISAEEPFALPTAIRKALAFCLAQHDYVSAAFEVFDRLPLVRALQNFDSWKGLAPSETSARIIESWIIAQHTYWSVGRGLADARGRGKTLLRLRIVMDEGGWTLTPGTSQGNPPIPTPDRLKTAVNLLKECGRIE